MHPAKDIQKTLLLVWPLLLGMFFIMVAAGLQGTLLSLRGKAEGFPASVIGIIMSMYYCGYVGGWFIVPRMIKSVGHVRVFAAFASMASTTILLQGLFIYPLTWAAVRFISGLSFVGLFIVSESWLNNIAQNKLRGRILSSYFFVINGGYLAGQFMLGLAPIGEITLFILTSILISLSLMPITLANKPSPGYEEPENLPFKKLIKTSPLSVSGVILSGFIAAGVLTIGPLYAEGIGYSPAKIASFIALFFLGCGTMPLLAGWLADNWDRRKLIIALTLIGIIATTAAFFHAHLIMLCIYFIGGCLSSIHSVSIAMMNDRLKPSQMTSATASMILINGASACTAPILIGSLFDLIGLETFFMVLGAMFSVVFVYGIYRHFKGPEIFVEDQGDYHAIPARAGPGIAHIYEDD